MVINAMDTRSRLSFGKRMKGEAVQFLKDNGVELGKRVVYAVLKDDGSGFWLNPKTMLLGCDWNAILNDPVRRELMVLAIPSDAVGLKTESSAGLFRCSDRSDLIDLTLNRDTLVDKCSGFDFSPYLLTRLPY